MFTEGGIINDAWNSFSGMFTEGGIINDAWNGFSGMFTEGGIINDAWNGFSGMFTEGGIIRTAFGSVTTSLTGMFTEGGIINTAFGTVTDGIGGLFAEKGPIRTAFGAITDTMGGLFTDGGLIHTAWNTLGDTLSSVGTSINNLTGTGENSITGRLSSSLGSFFGGVKSKGGSFFNSAASWISSPWTKKDGINEKQSSSGTLFNTGSSMIDGSAMIMQSAANKQEGNVGLLGTILGGVGKGLGGIFSKVGGGFQSLANSLGFGGDDQQDFSAENIMGEAWSEWGADSTSELSDLIPTGDDAATAAKSAESAAADAQAVLSIATDVVNSLFNPTQVDAFGVTKHDEGTMQMGAAATADRGVLHQAGGPAAGSAAALKMESATSFKKDVDWKDRVTGEMAMKVAKNAALGAQLGGPIGAVIGAGVTVAAEAIGQVVDYFGQKKRAKRVDDILHLGQVKNLQNKGYMTQAGVLKKTGGRTHDKLYIRATGAGGSTGGGRLTGEEMKYDDYKKKSYGCGIAVVKAKKGDHMSNDKVLTSQELIEEFGWDPEIAMNLERYFGRNVKEGKGGKKLEVNVRQFGVTRPAAFEQYEALMGQVSNQLTGMDQRELLISAADRAGNMGWLPTKLDDVDGDKAAARMAWLDEIHTLDTADKMLLPEYQGTILEFLNMYQNAYDSGETPWNAWLDSYQQMQMRWPQWAMVLPSIQEILEEAYLQEAITRSRTRYTKKKWAIDNKMVDIDPQVELAYGGSYLEPGAVGFLDYIAINQPYTGAMFFKQALAGMGVTREIGQMYNNIVKQELPWEFTQEAELARLQSGMPTPGQSLGGVRDAEGVTQFDAEQAEISGLEGLMIKDIGAQTVKTVREARTSGFGRAKDEATLAAGGTLYDEEFRGLGQDYMGDEALMGMRAEQVLGMDFGTNSSNTPTMAEGGVVTGPTIALIGEAGPEAVIPLDRAGQGSSDLLNEIREMNSMLRTIIANPYTVNMDGEKVGTIVNRATADSIRNGTRAA